MDAGYVDLLSQAGLGVSVNPEKSEPEMINDFLKRGVLVSPHDRLPVGEFTRQCAAKCHVDPQNPAPLMTATLTKMSKVARTPFALLNAEGQEQLLEECRFLLTARLPDDEIRDDTRMSFAAGRLATLAPRRIARFDSPPSNDRNGRFLRLLLRAVHAYPEKLRLWTRSLEFCRAVGRV